MKRKVSVCKMTWRSIRNLFGRYFALLLIVMLSVGFFSGLKITKSAMADTAGQYLNAQSFYDFEMISTWGYSEENVEAFRTLSYVREAEGGYAMDALLTYDDNENPYQLISIPEKINLPSLVAGRMPKAEDECLADSRCFTEADIGAKITLSENNTEDVLSGLEEHEYTIVGLANSPLYLNLDRGTTGIGSGAREGFLYILPENYTEETYTAVYATLTETAEIYSSAYDDLIETYEEEMTETAEKEADDRYQELLSDMGIPEDMAETYGFKAPEVYVLTRDENTGYVSFESDTSIISGISNIFPLFFIIIAMLVCITTMSRMVDEERTQIGVLKAMGLSNGRIAAKYMLYAGSATAIGWAIGFFAGTWGLPQIFWKAYGALYGFAPMKYYFHPYLAVLTLAAALLGLLGSTWIACRRELFAAPAQLIRPRAAKAGKRILLERIFPFWNRLSFLRKITIRNMFRYKKRLVMMLIGIGCCTALLVTGFGVRDSMIDIGSLQYGQIQKYDYEVGFSGDDILPVKTILDENDDVKDALFCDLQRVDLYGAEKFSSVNLLSFSEEEAENLSSFWDLKSDGECLAFPKKGCALVSRRVAEKLSLEVGDSFEIEDADMQTMTVEVSGVFENYVDNYVIVFEETMEEAFGEWAENTALVRVSDTSGGSVGISGEIDNDFTIDTIIKDDDLAKKLNAADEITSVTALSSAKETVENAMSCLDYIIWLIVLFAGALAFVVIFNLTNINLAERSREIATVEVLGFYPNETRSYVLRENLVLSVLAGILGLPLGTIFHRVVMGMILVDGMTFDVHIAPVSYLMALICTVAFALLVNLFMRRQIEKIPMAESLKAVE
jgi:putative ABC transport system permease protein